MDTRARPRHSAAQRFASRGLFRGIKDFRDLEARIAALATEKERGDAFEVLAEAYLATQRHIQADEVWPLERLPAQVRRRLRLTADDMGVDGVFRDTLGGHNAYQVKFRSGRRALTWTALATFMGLSDASTVDQRVLITNSNHLPKVMNERAGFFCIRGSDLDGLDERDFDAIARYLRGAEVEPTRKEPLPHQQEALDAIAAGLDAGNRATAVMACGTGKTLVALWAAERLRCRRVLVLVPSLALVRQTLHEWLRETRWERVSYLCVCSDPTVQRGLDNWVVEQSDLDFPVTTDSAAVGAFLHRPFGGVRVIFSTYQSAPVVAAGVGDGKPFDLGIFDEAHKTTGRKGTRFAFALRDENVAIKKRLFLTATPRHYDVLRRDKEGDARVVYSMDVPEDYGTVAYTLPFAEAARREIICDYRVVISVVTSDMLDRELLRRGDVLLDGDVVSAQRVADQIALRDAVAKFGMRRVFTFHSRVASAKSFVAVGGEGVQTHLPEFSVFHVNGKMRTADREDALREFGEAERGLISNARCLTEGVDVPAVDMVAFMSPKRSKVDIVQATGRAMRKDPTNPGKATGYVLLPLLMEVATGESLEEALARTRFDDVWTVLQAMQEQDAELADIIRELRQERGRTGGFDDRRLREKVTVLGPDVSLRQIEAAISTACVERLGVTWDERFGELLAYTDAHGDCNVPVIWPESPALATWVSTQRNAYKNGRLSDERRARLDEIGFVWNAYATAWEETFAALVAYRDAHGDCNVPHRCPALGTWALLQREKQRNGTLSSDLHARLDEIGFVWSPLDTAWEEMFAALVAYKKAHGDCNVPGQWSENPTLGAWVGTQRRSARGGRLGSKRHARLDALGFVWDTLAARWDANYAALVAYRDAHGDCNVHGQWSENPTLGRWVSTQRNAHKNRRLSDERRARLDALGFAWDAPATAWDANYAAMVAYRDAHGDCNVPVGWPDCPTLGTWVSTQRSAHKNGSLSSEQLARLDEIGFVWDVLDAAWEEMLAALVAYKATHGDCNVPRHWPDSPTLGTWVSNHRVAYKSGRLSDERRARLDDIGFVWDAHAAAWEEMFAALVAYAGAHGDCNVPGRWSENASLGTWVSKQRAAHKKRTLSDERQTRLDELGFEWTRGRSGQR